MKNKEYQLIKQELNSKVTKKGNKYCFSREIWNIQTGDITVEHVETEQLMDVIKHFHITLSHVFDENQVMRLEYAWALEHDVTLKYNQYGDREVYNGNKLVGGEWMENHQSGLEFWDEEGKRIKFVSQK